jgi:hypothetical protein
MQQAEESLERRIEMIVYTSRAEVVSRLDSRFAEDQKRWKERQDAYRSRTEEIADGLEKLGADTRRDLAETALRVLRSGPSHVPWKGGLVTMRSATVIRRELGTSVPHGTTIEIFTTAANRKLPLPDANKQQGIAEKFQPCCWPTAYITTSRWSTRTSMFLAFRPVCES